MKQGRLWHELECASLVIYVVCVLLLFIKKVMIVSPFSSSFSNGVHGLFPFFFFSSNCSIPDFGIRVLPFETV